MEDSELSELEEDFIDRFKSFCKPQGNLSSGSFILVGSMSHLARNGFFFGSAESPIQYLTTVDGMSICTNDGVHLTSNATRGAARLLMADIAIGRSAGEPAQQEGLESVIPAPPPAAYMAAVRPCHMHRRYPLCLSRSRRRAGFLARCWLSSGARGWAII